MATLDMNQLVPVYNKGLLPKPNSYMTVSDIAFQPPPLGESVSLTRGHAMMLVNKWTALFTLNQAEAARAKLAYERKESPTAMSIDDIDAQIAKLEEVKKAKLEPKKQPSKKGDA